MIMIKGRKCWRCNKQRKVYPGHTINTPVFLKHFGIVEFSSPSNICKECYSKFKTLISTYALTPDD